MQARCRDAALTRGMAGLAAPAGQRRPALRRRVRRPYRYDRSFAAIPGVRDTGRVEHDRTRQLTFSTTRSG